MQSLLLFVVFMFFLSQNNLDISVLREGDLLFQETNDEGLDKSIKAVTVSCGNHNFTHIGIVAKDSLGALCVIEAKPPKVCITPLQDFVNPSNENKPITVAARLKNEWQHLIPSAINYAKKLVGKDYDYEFDLQNDKYYCSELIYSIFYYSNKNKPVFELNKMSFKSTITGDYDTIWQTHFKKLNLPIPEGKDGINPGAMSRSSCIYFL